MDAREKKSPGAEQLRGGNNSLVNCHHRWVADSDTEENRYFVFRCHRSQDCFGLDITEPRRNLRRTNEIEKGEREQGEEREMARTDRAFQKDLRLNE